MRFRRFRHLAGVAVVVFGLCAGPVAAEPIPPEYSVLGREPRNLGEHFQALELAVREGNVPLRNRTFIALRLEGKRAVPGLIKRLKHENTAIGAYAAFILGWIDDERSLEPLMEGLEADEESMVRAAMKALGNRRHEPAIPRIAEFITDDDVDIARDAVYALGLTRSEKAREHLEPLREHDDKVMRFLANEALQRIETGW